MAGRIRQFTLQIDREEAKLCSGLTPTYLPKKGRPDGREILLG